MKHLRAWVLDTWRPLLAALAVVVVVGILLTFRIGSLTHGASLAEREYINTLQSGRQILNEPIFIVHKLPVYILFKLNIHRIGVYRLVSVFMAASMVVSTYFILKRWYSLRVALLGSWLALSAAATLHIGRLALPEASFLLFMPMVAAIVWMHTTTRPHLALVMLSFLTGFSLYIPGFFWLIVALYIWQRKDFWEAIKTMRGELQLLCGFIIIFCVLPLGLSAIQVPQNLLLAAGLPTHLPSISQIGKNILAVPMQLFIRGLNNPIYNLGRLPLLDVFSTVMIALGAYSLRYNLTHMRTQLVLGGAILFGILIAAGGLPVTVLLPLLYLLAAGGIGFMLQQWFTVFPRNPLARIIATTLVSVTVVMASFYNINRYFIAWPQTPATRQAFNQSLVK
ncbi:MAG TPA: hypothetical protein VM124_00130 [Candidatus Limnocylindrales bacterium]|nr:hypothetical protein [Candidatus Limnocylindrales bacterium]